MDIIIETLRSIEQPNVLRTRSSSRRLLKVLNKHSLTKRSRKLPIRDVAYRNLWTMLTNTNFLLLRPSNIMAISILKLKIFEISFICLSTWLKTAKLILVYWMSSWTNALWDRFYFLKNNSSVLLPNVIILWL